MGLALQAGLGVYAWIWFGVMATAHVVRIAYLLWLGEPGRVTPAQWLSRSAAAMVVLAVLRASVVLMIFGRPVSELHYVLTMIFVGSAVGAISPVTGHLRSYVGWAAILGGTLSIAWLTRGTLEGTAIATLLVLLFTVLTFYVRDEGRTLVTLVTLSESLRRERDRAEKASEAKTRFFAAASHDLRQPLTALSYNAATVQELARLSGDEMLDKVGQGIRRALSESSSLLDSLLEVSKLDAGAVRAESREVDVMQLLAHTCETLSPVANAADLDLRCLGGHHKGLWVRTDVALLRRIVQNLVGNAIKFTREGHVSIEAFADGTHDERVCIRVSDTGPGIPIEAQAHVFEEFYQVGNPERNRSRGLGLGLAIVRRIAHLLAVEVTMNSAPGQGCGVRDLATPDSVARPRGRGTQSRRHGVRPGQQAQAGSLHRRRARDPGIVDHFAVHARLGGALGERPEGSRADPRGGLLARCAAHRLPLARQRIRPRRLGSVEASRLRCAGADDHGRDRAAPHRRRAQGRHHGALQARRRRATDPGHGPRGRIGRAPMTA